MRSSTVLYVATALMLSAGSALAQPRAAAQDPSADLLRQATEQMRDGHAEDALATARRALAASPQSYQANNQMGALLDLAGRYKDAREAFAKAADVAPTPDNKARAQRAIAISYGFESDCGGAAKYEAPLYHQYLDARDFYNAGEVANELARLCLDAGKIDEAERQDLWHYRLEHALARIAARRGNQAEAQKHVAAAKAILDRGTMAAQQKEYFPYLAGYVALYTGDYQTALTQLQQGNQSDAYVLGLIAQTYEKLGQNDKAMEYYRKVMASTVHNPTTAGSRPLARTKLAAK